MLEMHREGQFDFDTTYTYDRLGRVTQISHQLPSPQSPAPSPFTSYHYAYDLAHRITAQTTTHDASLAVFTNADAAQLDDFTFDDAGQLLGDGTDTFAYDDAGNRSNGTVNGDHNRLESDGAYDYEYDGEGNVVRRTAGDNTYDLYTWDHRNRLTKFEAFDAGDVLQSLVLYQYNADGNFISRGDVPVVNGAPNYFATTGDLHVYHRGERALTFDETLSLTDRYAWGAGGLLFDETYTAGALDDVLWAASDHLGTVNQLLDEAGALVEHREYDSFGALDAAFDEVGAAKSTNNLLTEVAYTGHWFDRNLDAYITPTRIYDPSTGRFLSEDPAGFAADGPNLYRYARNNPVNFRDPSGLSPSGNPLNNLRIDAAVNSFLGVGVSPAITSNVSFSGFDSTATALSTPSYSAPRIDPAIAAALKTREATLAAATADHDRYKALLSRELQDTRLNARGRRANGNQISHLRGQVNTALQAKSLALDNFYNAQHAAEGSVALQTFRQGQTEYVSVGGEFRAGLGTGGKAVTNSLVSTGTFGFVDEAIGVTQADLDRGYATSRFIAGVSSEILFGVATGGASRYGRVGKTILAADTAANLRDVGVGAIDVYNNGLSAGNALQIAGGGLGLGGNVAAGARAYREIASDAARVRVGFDTATFSSGGLGGVNVSLAPKGGITYGALDALGRPSGVTAVITSDLLGTGTAASRSIRPPGFLGGSAGQARGHLVGRQLGGSGSEPRNLVTLFQNPANSPTMRSFENQIRSAVEGGQTFTGSFTPIYNGTNLIPRGVTIQGSGAGGFQIGVTVLNR